MEKQKKTIGVLERALIILQCFSETNKELYLKDFVQITGFDRATISRALNVFQEFGFIRRAKEGFYTLGISANHIGYLYRETHNNNAAIQYILQNIVEKVNESAAFYIIDGQERVCIYANNANRTIQHRFKIGQKIKLSEGGSAGHVLRTFTNQDTALKEDILKNGYAITSSEREVDQISISVPLFDVNRSFIGVIVVAGIKSRFSKESRQKIIKTICEEIINGGFTYKA